MYSRRARTSARYTIEATTMGKNKLSEADIDSVIRSTRFERVSDRMTICVLTLANGYEVLGQSSCADAANYKKADGERHAWENARSQVWQLEGYKLRDALYAAAGVEGAVHGMAETCCDSTVRLDDVPVMMHRLASDIENAVVSVVRAVVVTHSGAVGAPVVVYGFGDGVQQKAPDMCRAAVRWFGDQTCAAAKG